MAKDILLSRKNEVLVNKARSLGFKDVIFVDYYSQNMNLLPLDAVIISTDSLDELRRLIDKLSSKKKKIIVQASSDEINRTALESKKVWMLLAPEFARADEKEINFRNSGLNQVLCKLAAQKGIFICINLSELLSEQGKRKAILLARIMQNIKLCRKYKARIILASFSREKEAMLSASDMKNLALSFGMSTQQAKQAVLD